jgi:hypothetical protein
MSGRIFYQEQVMTAVGGIITAYSFAEKIA